MSDTITITTAAVDDALRASAAYLADAATIDPPTVVTSAGVGTSIPGGTARDVIVLPPYGYTAAIGVLAHEIAHLEAGSTVPTWSRVCLGVAVLSAGTAGWGAATAVFHDQVALGVIVAALAVVTWVAARRLGEHAIEIAADHRATVLIEEGLGGDGPRHTVAALDAALADPETTGLERLLVRHRRTLAAREVAP